MGRPSAVKWYEYRALFAAEIHCERLGDAGFVTGEIVEREHSPALLRGFDDGGGDGAAVKTIAALLREKLHRAREVGIREERVDGGEFAAGEVEAGEFGVFLGDVELDLECGGAGLGGFAGEGFAFGELAAGGGKGGGKQGWAAQHAGDSLHSGLDPERFCTRGTHD